MPSPEFEKTYIYGQSLALLTDLYQLTMVYGYWKSGLYQREAVFHINFRRWPFKGGYAIAAGLETAAEFIHNLRYSDSDLAYVGSLKNSQGKPLFEKEFLEFLRDFAFCCDVDAVPEGTLIFPYEPLIRITGPIWQAQLLESPLLNLMNFQTLIATKASRICQAAHPDPVIEFGMRRAQGIDGAVSASRAAFIGGCVSSSDVIAGKLFDIPIKGTHAHSWIMAFDEEEEAFEEFAKVMPVGCFMLVDTYDSIAGVKKAIKVAQRIKGFTLEGVRIDSGDLTRLSIECRNILDQAGFTKTEIMASNELDEYLISDLKQQGAKITVWGVGTHLVTASGQSALDGVYKLSAIRDSQGKWIYKIKISDETAKVTNPGILQIRRYFDGKQYVGDVLYDELMGIKGEKGAISYFDPHSEWHPKGLSYHDLLVPVFRKGELVYQFPHLKSIQAYKEEELLKLPAEMKRFTNPERYFIGLEKGLYQKKIEMIKRLKKSV